MSSGEPIIVLPMSGLCNRMRAIDSAMALGRAWNRPLRVMWLHDKDVGAPFQALFRPIQGIALQEAPDAITATLGRWGRFKPLVRTWEILSGERCYYHNENDRLSNDLVTQADRLRPLPLRIASFGRFYGERVRYEQFVPVPAIAERVDAITQAFRPSTVGVHIRRTDNRHSVAVSTDDKFMSYMQTEIDHDHSTTFYIASDSLEAKRTMLQHFGDRVITDMTPADRTTLSGMQTALVELYALSRTRKILGSHWSSFSHTAAHIGGIEETEVL